MSGMAKIISTIIVLLLLIGLAFGIFSFVDSSKANERLNSEKQNNMISLKRIKDKDKDKKR